MSEIHRVQKLMSSNISTDGEVYAKPFRFKYGNRSSNILNIARTHKQIKSDTISVLSASQKHTVGTLFQHTREK